MGADLPGGRILKKLRERKNLAPRRGRRRTTVEGQEGKGERNCRDPYDVRVTINGPEGQTRGGKP